jgi:hypothetical protein
LMIWNEPGMKKCVESFRLQKFDPDSPNIPHRSNSDILSLATMIAKTG